jgi:hypothetical protein
VQTKRLTGKVAETKGLPLIMYKEQNGARPLRAEADSWIAELGRDVRKKVAGEKTSVTKIPEMGKRED